MWLALQLSSALLTFSSHNVQVITLLAGLTCASSAVERRAQPPEADDICRPVGIDTPVSRLNTPSFLSLMAQVKAFANQLWFIQPVNHGNSFAIVSTGPTSNVCAQRRRRST
ncbi:hypothetical protein M422DRAFT_273956 [Sphaerobolus stellatus SS14]|uniref:Secreted protein n=1 Tax=Sphaerobolus stellatus (strain SS14) TaxID=990650 RepID=A0A0C9TTA4_SPHS4|nr:hypothetical protein M422DRAFT_273956 [Sphaerobolus stellatus SS14]